MRILQAFLILVLVAASVGSEEETARTARQATNFFQAEEYEDAIRVYEEAMEHATEDWQRVALEYNRANALILHKRTGEGLQSYQGLSQQGLFPELAARVSINDAVGTIMRAQEMPTEDKDAASLGLIYVQLWKEAVKSAEAAEKAVCRRDNRLGASACPTSPDIVALKLMANEGLVGALARRDKDKISESTPEASLPTLQGGVGGLIDLLRVVASPTIDKAVTAGYQKYYQSLSDSWQTVWKETQAQLGNKAKEYLQAYTAFDNASKQVASGDFLGARQSLELSLRSLQASMDALFVGKSDEELLQMLLAGYSHAASGGYVDPAMLHMAARQVQGLADKGDATTLLNKINNLALDRVENGDEAGALLAVEAAQVTAKMWLAQISTAAKTPKGLLRRLTEDQHGIMDINRSYIEQGKNGRMKEILTQLQESLLTEAKEFPGVVKSEQDAQWDRGTFTRLSSSWVDISSLFDEGFAAAKQARDTLAVGSSDAAMPLQMTAFDDWMGALNLLHQMQQQEQDMAASSAPEPSPNTPSTSSLMQQLEAMEQDDKSLSTKFQGVTPEKTDRPW